MKKFASFLVAGKLGLAPFALKASSLPKEVKNVPVTEEKVETFASAISSIGPEVFFEKTLHIVEYPESGVVLQNLYNDAMSSPYDTASAYIEIPGEGCEFGAPSEIKLIVTGVRPGEEVFIVASPEKNNNQELLEKSHGKLKVGLSGLKILAIFNIEAEIEPKTLPGALTLPIEGVEEGSIVPIILRVNIGAVKDGDKFYIQAIAFPEGDYSWDKARASELDLIEVQEKTCSPYGGTGAPY